ncbi:TIGR02147 family protein [Bdellovibrio bacteriovorus]|uniref:TIGR02147 family protein n=1 Tax=Bdellovibrio bacteriovorus TaxID=959 RepID=UPI0035A5DF7E
MTVQKFMQSQLKKRQEKNPKFSLRSFARLLKTDPSSLSKILNGLRIPSDETVEKWVDCLKLSSEETAELKNAITETHSFNPLNADFFESTYSWVHPILLETLKLPNAPRNLPLLAELFGMSVEKIEQTISFLENHQILHKNPHGPGYTTSNLTTVQIPYTSDLRRNLQKKYLEMAQKALEEVPLEKRDNSTLTVAIHTDDIPAMKDIIREARLKIHRLAEKRKHQLNAVYNFSSAFYPVNQETL